MEVRIEWLGEVERREEWEEVAVNVLEEIDASLNLPFRCVVVYFVDVIPPGLDYAIRRSGDTLYIYVSVLSLLRPIDRSVLLPYYLYLAVGSSMVEKYAIPLNAYAGVLEHPLLIAKCLETTHQCAYDLICSLFLCSHFPRKVEWFIRMESLRTVVLSRERMKRYARMMVDMPEVVLRHFLANEERRRLYEVAEVIRKCVRVKKGLTREQKVEFFYLLNVIRDLSQMFGYYLFSKREVSEVVNVLAGLFVRFYGLRRGEVRVFKWIHGTIYELYRAYPDLDEFLKRYPLPTVLLAAVYAYDEKVDDIRLKSVKELETYVRLFTRKWVKVDKEKLDRMLKGIKGVERFKVVL